MAERAPAKAAGVVSYVSTAPAYVGGGYIEPGTPFSTDARPARAWTVLAPATVSTGATTTSA